MDQWTLLDTIAAPDATVDKDLHLPLKAAGKLVLSGRQMGEIVDLRPAALLFFAAYLKIPVVGKRRRKSFRNVRNLHCHSSIGFILVAIHRLGPPGRRSPEFAGRGSLDPRSKYLKPTLLPDVWPRCSDLESDRSRGRC